jgi:ribose transport system substrate-binding protein
MEAKMPGLTRRSFSIGAAAIAGFAGPFGYVAARAAAPSGAAHAEAAIANLSASLIGKGPKGETAVSGDTLELSADEESRLRGMQANAAICMFAPIGWTTAQVAGIQSEFGRLGIKVIAVTNGEGKVDKQVSDVETLIARKPNVIVTVQADGNASGPVFKRVSAEGIKTVFIGQATAGAEYGRDYISVVDSDEYAYGAISAHLLALALDGQGKVGLLYWQTKFFNTDQRAIAFRDVLKSDYPGMEIVEEKGFLGPNFAHECEVATNAWAAPPP